MKYMICLLVGMIPLCIILRKLNLNKYIQFIALIIQIIGLILGIIFFIFELKNI